MYVETYEVLSVDVNPDGSIVNETVDAEAMALIEQLGLAGQKELLSEHEVDGEAVITRNPYRLITAEELAIFSTLMPRRTRLDTYRDGPVPLRVLQIASHATKLFERLVVWHPEPGQVDPVLVGENGSEWNPSARFILARWGEELCSYEELRAKALPIIRSRMKSHLARARADLAALEASLDEQIDHYLHGGKVNPVFASVSFTN